MFLKKSSIDELGDINVYRARAVAEQMEIENFMRELLHDRLTHKLARIKAFCDKFGYNADQNMQAAIIVPTLYAAMDKKMRILLRYQLKTSVSEWWMHKTGALLYWMTLEG